MPGDQKNQAPNPLSAEITSVETDFIRAKQIAKVNFFLGGDGGMGGGFNIICDWCA